MKFSVPIPANLQHLKLDSRGYPIPFFVPIIDGAPNFKLLDERKQLECIEKRLCPICGKKLFKDYSYVITGPLGYNNKVVTDPPMHRECAEFSLKACPHMYFEKAERKKMSQEEAIQARKQHLALEKSTELFLIRTKHHAKTRNGAHYAIRFDPVSATKYVYENGLLVEKETS
jgi:hypothetical protein